MNIRNIHFSISICHRLRSKLALRPAFSCYSQSPSSLSHPVEVQDLVENSPWEWWRPSSGFTLLKIRNVLKLSCHWVVTFLEKTISQFVWMILFHQTCLSRCVMGLFHSFAHTPWSDRKSDRQPNPPPPKEKKHSDLSSKKKNKHQTKTIARVEFQRPLRGPWVDFDWVTLPFNPTPPQNRVVLKAAFFKAEDQRFRGLLVATIFESHLGLQGMLLWLPFFPVPKRLREGTTREMGRAGYSCMFHRKRGMQIFVVWHHEKNGKDVYTY